MFQFELLYLLCELSWAETDLFITNLDLSCNAADLPSSHELSSYYSREDERGAHRVIRDTDPIGASYDRYLRSSVLKFILLQIGIHVG